MYRVYDYNIPMTTTGPLLNYQYAQIHLDYVANNTIKVQASKFIRDREENEKVYYIDLNYQKYHLTTQNTTNFIQYNASNIYWQPILVNDRDNVSICVWIDDYLKNEQIYRELKRSSLIDVEVITKNTYEVNIKASKHPLAAIYLRNKTIFGKKC